MSVYRIITLAAALAAPSVAGAETPNVVVDILPLHSLAAQVMQGVGTPHLLLPSGADPHSYTMKPSDARALSKADLTLWIGPELMPWLGEALPRLAPDTRSVDMLHAKGSTVLSVRHDALFSGLKANEEQHTHVSEHEHTHLGTDPHAWLDPKNAQAWVLLIAEELAALDPENADRYHDNALKAKVHLTDLSKEIAVTLPQNTQGGWQAGLFVFHDTYQYFEHRFSIPIAGALSPSDAAAPGAARVGTINTAVAAYDYVCVLAEPLFNDRLVKTATGGRAKVAVLDPLGAHIPAGPDHYASLLLEIAQTIAGCNQ